jgi:hypothetical protein
MKSRSKLTPTRRFERLNPKGRRFPRSMNSTLLGLLVEDDAVGWMSHTVFKPKLKARSMCAQESSSHTYCIENGYRITNVTIYNIFTE